MSQRINIPKERKVKIVREICKLYESSTMSIRECISEVANRSPKTFFRWLNANPDLKEIYDQTKKRCLEKSLQKSEEVTEVEPISKR